MKRIKQNNAMAVKLGIKGVKSSMDAMQTLSTYRFMLRIWS